MKKMTSFIIPALASLLMAASCSQAGGNQDQARVAEVLYGIQLHKDKLTIRVKSNGCTKADDFKLQTEEQSEYVSLTVVRTKSDRCRKMPRVIRVELDLPVTTENGYRLVNPLQSG